MSTRWIIGWLRVGILGFAFASSVLYNHAARIHDGMLEWLAVLLFLIACLQVVAASIVRYQARKNSTIPEPS